MNNLAVALLLFLLSTTVVFSQGKDDWEIELSSGEKFYRVDVDTLRGDTLIVSHFSNVVAVDVRLIERMAYDKGSRFWTGAGIGAGAAAGFAFVAATQSDAECNGCVLIAVPILAVGGFLVGGLVGATIDDEVSYDFSGKSPAERRTFVEYIIALHQPPPSLP